MTATETIRPGTVASPDTGASQAPPWRIAVVGGGIGGLAFALAAHRAGLRVMVYEKAEAPGDTEAGLQISPNAARVLEWLGVGDALYGASVRPASLEFRHWQGAVGGEDAVLLRVPLRPRYAERFGAEYHVLHRAELRRVLAGAVSTGVVRRGRRCVAVEEDADGARLVLADRSGATVETVRADLVVGADGVASVVRAAQRRAGEAVFSGMRACRALVPVEALPRGGADVAAAVRVWPGPGAHVVWYPVAGGRYVNLVVIAPTDRDDEPGTWGRPVAATEVAATCAGWDPLVVGAVAAARRMTAWPLYEMDALPGWSTAHTTLLGDAAHPMLPHQAQGAGQAVEDAAVLAVLLRTAHHLGLAEVLRRYEALRRPRTADLQRSSREHGRLMHSAQGVELARLLTADDVVELMAPVYGYDAVGAARLAADGVVAAPGSDSSAADAMARVPT